MVNEIDDAVVDEISKIKFYDVTYDDGKTSEPREFEDDGFIHISRGKYRFVFYNGQGKGMLTEKRSMPSLVRQVDAKLRKLKFRGK